jgi:hypothetical protein
LVNFIHNIVCYFYDKVLKIEQKKHEFKIKKIFRFSYGDSDIVFHEDGSISFIGKDSHVFINEDMIDENGELFIKIKEVDRFYADNAPLKTCKNFPDRVDVVMINNTQIEEVDLDYVGNGIFFKGLKLKKLRIKRTKLVEDYDKEFSLTLHGDLSHLDTLAYLPIGSSYSLCSPFVEINDEIKERPNESYLILKKSPRSKLFIEHYMLSTKKQITGIKYNHEADPNHFFSILHWMMVNDKKIYGAFEHYKDFKWMISWPENFFNENTKKSTKGIVKFNL